MKRRTVGLSSAAIRDLSELYDHVAIQAGSGVARAYVERIKQHCSGFALASERGQKRDDIRPGLRMVGFERRATILFSVEGDRVTILRVFAAGRNWETEP